MNIYFESVSPWAYSPIQTVTYSLIQTLSMIDDGMYIYFHGVDDFYLPEKSWYGTRHMNHDGIICGYDDNDSNF